MLCKTFAILLISTTVISALETNPCPCSTPEICAPIKDQNRTEVFAFVLPATETVWSKFDWNKTTTIVLCGLFDPALYCHAHENGVRVVTLQNYPVADLLDSDLRQAWIQKQVNYAQALYLDGINIDFEDVVEAGSHEVYALNALVQDTADAFHDVLPDSQVTFDIPFAPYNDLGQGVDGRNYDFVSLAKACDFLVIMSYDQRSQVFHTEIDGCLAQANSGVYVAIGGVQAFLDLGIEPSKLVFGQPWYGYDYVCIEPLGDDGGHCVIKETPWRGVNCSDAVGTQISYGDIEDIYLELATSTWDPHSDCYFINYVDLANVTHQIWYDTIYSYQLKYHTITEMGLRGVSMWNANSLNYDDDNQVNQMWGVLPSSKTSRVFADSKLFDSI
ncbi:Di-N-acetylchitobiase [Halotydeus destructor]|nr:Di-N-acetylchitobiase [Halotydeus destructor]